jgi:Mg-chelatase subunit ChlD/lysophospholipase L1-like esterase
MRTRPGAVGRVLAVAAVLALLLVGHLATAGQARAAAGDTDRPVYLVMDVSGSMNDGAKEKKINAAKRAAYRLLDEYPRGQQITLQAFPWNDCNAGPDPRNPSPLDRGELSASVRALVAGGGTPTSAALRMTMRSFEAYADATGVTGGTVILLSDGEANCGSDDICTVGRQIHDAGLSLVVNPVGFDISEEGARQLRCLADATGGTYVAVPDGGDLDTALWRAGTPALSVRVDAPEAVQTVTGSHEIAGSANRITVTVTPTGSRPANDVRVNLTVTDAQGSPGAIHVGVPVRFLGNLGGSVASGTQAFALRPYAGVAAPLTYTVTVTARNTPTVVKTGTMTVVDSATFASAGAILKDAKHIVVLGDSYSSGEGAGDYDSSDDRGSDTFRCHRSANAWGRVLLEGAGEVKPKLSFLPCSGAVTGDLQRYQHFWGTPPQLTGLKELAASDTPPDVVLMTLGGNDAGFAKFIAGCVRYTDAHVTKDACGVYRSMSGSSMLPYLLTDTLEKDLVTSYGLVDRVLNAPEVVRKRGGRAAQLVVLPYPNPLPPTQRDASGCFLGLSAKEIEQARLFVHRVDNVVYRAIDAAAEKGVPIHTAWDVYGAFQDGYTICDNQPAVITDGTFGRSVNPTDALRGQESMHPNTLGQRLMANALIEWSRDEAVDWTKKRTDPDTEVWVENRYLATFRNLRGDQPNAWFGLQPRVEPKTILPTCSTLVALDVCTTVTAWKVNWVRIESDPRFLGFSNRDLGEDPLAGMYLPGDIPAGRHTLVFTGVDDEGAVHELRAPIIVERPGTFDAKATGVLGLVLIVPYLGTRTWAALRRRRSGRRTA